MQNKSTTVKQETPKLLPAQLKFQDMVSTLMRNPTPYTKDTKVTFGKKQTVNIPAGTVGKDLKQSEVAAMMNISTKALSQKVRKTGLKWHEISWGETFLPGGHIAYLQNLVENQGLGWVAIEKHLAALNIFKDHKQIQVYYKNHLGIYGQVDNDHRRGTKQMQLCHIHLPVIGQMWPRRHNTPGVYLDPISHRALDTAARELWVSNGLIYAIYGPNSKDALGANRLVNGSSAWITNNFRTRFGRKAVTTICKELGINPECQFTFTPAPLA